ncbi:DUF4062 domain-containing protein [Endozoicomonas sp. ALD040]|uniref:DUF4062 domain-containing protein n=1 Tax=Endozoicomonas sp. ALD040 TaxID=3403079 RepID=UPI003BAE7ED6
MNKRFQVFVSSTYKDLSEERAEVMQALLELDCMPSGMELFPAANEEQWNWIKKVIDESDYYIVILGGRYGSISKNTGMSYTEMEYRYAVETGKPVIAFLHENPGNIVSAKTEKSESNNKKLSQFRALCEQKLCKYWNSPVDLGAKVSRSITQLIKHEPAIGWTRADQVIEDQSSKILELNKKIKSLEETIRKLSAKEPSGIEGLSKGNDKLSISCCYETKVPTTGKNNVTYWKKGKEYDYDLKTTWDSLFAYIAPEIINPSSEYRITARINSFIKSGISSHTKKKHKDCKIENIRVYTDSFDIIKIQLRALKLIEIIEDDYWSLTSYGDRYMNNLLAIKTGIIG